MLEPETEFNLKITKKTKIRTAPHPSLIFERKKAKTKPKSIPSKMLGTGNERFP
jgi:hypothetical protein